MEREREAATIVRPGLPKAKIFRKLISVPKGHAANNTNKTESRNNEKLNSSPTAKSCFEMQCRGLPEVAVTD